MAESEIAARTAEDRSLELDGPQMRAFAERVTERVIRHIESLGEQPAGYDLDAGARARAIRAPIAEDGGDVDELLGLIFDRAVIDSFNSAAPGYLAYIPGGGMFAAAMGDYIADAINRYTGVWVAAPLLVELETDVIRWLIELVGYPKTARGLLTTGGSMATFSALVTAREERLGERFQHGLIYVGDQVHHCVQKAAKLAGFPAANVVVVESDARFRVRVDRLAERVRADRAAGRHPFLVIGSAGTTNTGAVDDLVGLAEVARAERLWYHIDAAYGGFFQLTEHGRRLLVGLGEADSLVLDPHKGLFVPYGSGALLVKDGLALRRAHAVHADYMPSMQAGDGSDAPIDFCEHGPDLSRGYRGLRVWLPLKLHGVRPFRANLEEKLSLTNHAVEMLRRIDGIEIVAEPQLTVLAFRLVRAGLDDAALNRLNRRLLDRILASGRVWLTATELGGRFVIRICVLHFRTHRDRIDECLRIVAAAARAV